MILVDTSVWIDFFRGRTARLHLAAALESDAVATHSFVIGELCLGNLGRRRGQVLADLEMLPALPMLLETEVRGFVESRHIAGTGIGWVDAHLLASAFTAEVEFWTLDRRLSRVAARLGIEASDPGAL